MMKRTYLWIIAAALFLFAAWALFFHRPAGRSDLASRGVRDLGTVQVKERQPGDDGQTAYYVTFIFADAQKKNHMVRRQVYDLGVWESLKEGGDVRVRYLPENPDEASIEGAEGLAAPPSGALRFLAWSALVAALVVAYLAWKAPKEGPGPARPKGGGPVVTHRE